MWFKLSVLFLYFAALITAATCQAPVIDLGYAKFSGAQNSTSGINYYRGLRYAQPPVGDLRWQPPRQIETSNYYNGTVDASSLGPICVQGTPYWRAPPVDLGNQAEDCLLLDVYVPMNPVSSSIPVLVQIHGGGYTQGSTMSSPGDAIVNASDGNIIYVAIQYRLGVYGFLGGAEVANNGTLNAGLLDQRSALEWVQRHIAAFGGDPTKVTITGGSAGGGSTAYQLIAYGGEGDAPFRAAIPEYPWMQVLNTPSTQEIQYRTLLNQAECNSLACLRALSAEDLKNTSIAVYYVYNQPQYAWGAFDYGPVIDGSFIRNRPDEEFKSGHFYDVALLADHDAYEGVAYTNKNATGQVNETADLLQMFPRAGPTFTSRLYELYNINDYNSTFFQRVGWFSDFIIDCPTYYMASAAVDFNSNPNNVYKMIFYAGSELHGAIGPFLYSNDTARPGANNQTIAELLTSYYVSFVVTLDPNIMKSSEAIYWPPYIAGASGNVSNGEDVGFTIMSITYTTFDIVPDPDKSNRCDFMSSQGYVLTN